MVKINIHGLDNDIIDIFYRYKREKIICTKLKNKTRIDNLKIISLELNRDINLILNFIKIKLGINIINKKNEIIITKDVNIKKLENIINEFIEYFILCPLCRLPETVINIKNKKCYLYCKCCSGNEEIKSNSKDVSKLILKIIK